MEVKQWKTEFSTVQRITVESNNFESGKRVFHFQRILLSSRPFVYLGVMVSKKINNSFINKQLKSNFFVDLQCLVFRHNNITAHRIVCFLHKYTPDGGTCINCVIIRSITYSRCSVKVTLH